MGRGGDEDNVIVQCIGIVFGVCLGVGIWQTVAGARGYYTTHEWAKGQCLVHSSHVSMRYYLESTGETSESKTLVALTHDVTVYTGALPSMRELDEIDAGRPQSSSQFIYSTGGVRAKVACEEYSVGHGTCAVDDEYDYDSDCDTPASDCDEDEGPSGFWQLTRKAGRGGSRPGLDCGCEICAVSSKYCDDNILRFGFFNADGTGNSMHRPSCCAVGRDDKVVPSARAVKNEGACKFPFTYDGHRYDSCTIIGTHKAFTTNREIWCGLTSDADKWANCDMNTMRTPVTVKGNTNTNASATPRIFRQCWIDSAWRGANAGGTPNDFAGVEDFQPVSFVQPPSADSFFVNLIGGIVLLSLACLSCVGGAIAVFVSS